MILILGMPLSAWLGILIFILIVTQVSLGIAMVVYQKNVLKYHRIIGFSILGLAVIHGTLGVLYWLKGILI